MQEFLRRYATPLSVVAFAVIGITGLMMFFGVRSRQLNHLHEWFGLAFVLIGLLHVFRNAKSFGIMFRQKRSKVVIAVTGIISAVFLAGAIQASMTAGPNPRRVQAMVTQRLADAPLDKLAPALGLSDEAAIARLQGVGIQAAPAQSLNQVAAASGKSATDLYLMLMDGQGGAGGAGRRGQHQGGTGH